MDYLYLYLLVLVLILGLFLARRWRRDSRNQVELAEAIELGLNEPSSLHPVVDLARCIGSGGCAKACPEEALGIVMGKAVLKNGAGRHGSDPKGCRARATGHGLRQEALQRQG